MACSSLTHDCCESRNVIFCGNPGAGKSTLLNCLMRQVRFHSGVSIGTGLTFQFDSATVDGTRFMDTPGLSDVKMRNQAAVAIAEALRSGGFYRLVFVITLEALRLKPDDITMIRLVLEASPEIKDYGIIINKLTKKEKKILVQHSAMTKLLDVMYADTNLLRTDRMFLNLYNEGLDGEMDALVPAPADLREFLSSITECHLNPQRVQDINVNDFEKCREEAEALKKEVASQQEALRQQKDAVQRMHQEVIEKQCLQEKRRMEDFEQLNGVPQGEKHAEQVNILAQERIDEQELDAAKEKAAQERDILDQMEENERQRRIQREQERSAKLKKRMQDEYAFIQSIMQDNEVKTVDLMIVLDVSGSMAWMCNGVFEVFTGTVLSTAKLPVGIAACGISFFASAFGADIFTGAPDMVKSAMAELLESWQSKLSECKSTIIQQLRAQVEQGSIRRVGLIAFNHDIVQQIQLTDDIDSVILAIDTLSPAGATKLYDCVAKAKADLESAALQDPQTVQQLLVLTDGIDNCSVQQPVVGIKQQRPVDDNGLQAFFIGIGEGNASANREFAQSMDAEFEGINASYFLKSGGSAAIQQGFKRLQRRQSHHQRTRRQRWQNSVQIPTPENFD